MVSGVLRGVSVGVVAGSLLAATLPLAGAVAAVPGSTPPSPPGVVDAGAEVSGRQRGGKGELAVRVLGLRDGVPGRVRVTGEGVREVVRSDSRLRLPAGTYRVTALASGSFEPQRPVRSVQVWSGSVARVAVSYRQVRLRVRVTGLSTRRSTRSAAVPVMSLLRGKKLVKRFSATTDFHQLSKGVYQLKAGTLAGYTVRPARRSVKVFSPAANRFQTVSVRVRRVGPEPTPQPTPSPTPSPTNPDWDPTTVAPLAVSPTGAGALPPTYPNALVTGQQGLAVSLRPTLLAQKSAEGVQHQFTVLPLSGTKPLWQGPSGTNRVTLPAGLLKNGASYRWQAKNLSTGEEFGPFIMQVDTLRSGIQATQPLAGFSVSMASGELQTGVGLGSTPSPSGPLGMTLGYLFGQPSQTGLPDGWMLASLAAPWSHITVHEGGSIELVSVVGNSLSYVVADGSGAKTYTPAVPAGWKSPTGQSATIYRNDDDTWTASTVSGDIAIFGPPDENGNSYLTNYSSTTSVLPEARYDQGRLQSVSDPVTGQAVTAYYQGSSACPQVPADFVAPSDGMLCAVVHPTGLSTQFFYLRTDAGKLVLARVVTNPDTVDSKPDVTDFGYDQAGRLVSQRNALAVDAIAARLREDDSSLLSEVTYDSAGRVSRVTPPAAQAGDPRPEAVVRYATGVSILDSPDLAPTAGFLNKTVYDPATMQPTAGTNSLGQTTTLEWDNGADRIASTTAFTGLRSATEYNDAGAPVSMTGPWPKSEPETPSTPKTTFAYDRDVSGTQSTPSTGFNTVYWSNAQLLGLPQSRSHGPKIDGGVPAKTQWTWPQSPTGGGAAAWGTRMTGALVVDADGVYHFTVSNSASVWIDNVLCEGTCTMPLQQGLVPIRVDLRVTSPGPDGSASISVEWDASGSMRPIDMADVRPTYGNLSVTSSRDALSVSDLQEKVVFNQFDQPWNGLATGGWNKAYPSAQAEVDYEDFDPGAGQLSRLVSYTSPTGSKTLSDYWAVGDKATAPCDGMREQDQHAMPKSFTRSVDPAAAGGDGQALTYKTYYDRFNLPAAGVMDGVDAPFCIYRNDVGTAVETRVPQVGDAPAITTRTETFVDNDPFQSRETTTIGDRTYVTQVSSDLFGRPTLTRDVWGTTTRFTYNPYTGATTQVQTTTASGYSSTSDYLFNNDGQLMKVLIDGEAAATIVRTGTYSGHVDYGNEVTLSARMADSGRPGPMEWTDSQGRQFSYETQVSPSGRLLEENYDFGSEHAQFQYEYDTMSRLVHAHLDTSLPVAESDWKYEFSATNPLGTAPTAGLNSNRSRLTINGSKIIDYGYDAQDRLIATTDPGIGDDIEYDDASQMTRIGELQAQYYGTGEPFQVVDTGSGDSVRYWRSSNGVIAKTSVSGGTSVESRFTAGGIVLDDQNRPMVRMIELPGGAVLTRDLAGDRADTWTYVTLRGQAMWSSDADGQAIGKPSLYEPYGRQIVTDDVASDNPFEPDLGWLAGFGLPSDTVGESGLVAMGSRLYLPSVGRFTSPDPIAYGSANQFDYANADPINQTDASGAFPVWGKVGLMIVGFGATLAAGKGINYMLDNTASLQGLKKYPALRGFLAGSADTVVAFGVSYAIFAVEGGGNVGILSKVYMYGLAFGAMSMGYLTGKGKAVVQSMVDSGVAGGKAIVQEVGGTGEVLIVAAAAQAEEVGVTLVQEAGTQANKILDQNAEKLVKALVQTQAVLDSANATLATLNTNLKNGTELLNTLSGIGSKCASAAMMPITAVKTGYGYCQAGYDWWYGQTGREAAGEDTFFDARGD